MEEKYGYLLEDLIKLRDQYYKCEEELNEPVWGECASDIDDLIEKAADQK